MADPFVYNPARTDPERAHEIHRMLRDDHPLYHNEPKGFWAVSRFADVVGIVNDPARFSSEGTSLAQGQLPHIQIVDPPRHDALRNLVSQAFTPRRVEQMAPRIREIARELVGGFAGLGRCDLRAEFARHLPSRVIGEMIGVPLERRKTFLEHTERMVEVPPGTRQSEALSKLAPKIYEEFATILDERRRERRDDLMSALLDAEVEGRKLTQEELLGFCFVLIVAGNDTTTNLIANGAVMLARYPEQRRALAADPALLPNAIEEMLRFESPVQVVPRRTREAVEIHGIPIPAGEEIKLMLGAANRDEREFRDPDRFDIRRDIRRHLAFGLGIHFCLGAKLARLEARIAFEELLARMPDYDLESEPRWVRSVWARAHAGVPIVFDPTAEV